MHSLCPNRRPLRAAASAGAAALIAAGGALGAVAGSPSWKVQKSPNPGGSKKDNFLNGVAATSATNAWAVGSYNAGVGSADQTIIERWDGKAWKTQQSPNPGGSHNNNILNGVAAASAKNAWAAGWYYNGTTSRTLIEHWNGKVWRVQKSPNPSGSDLLFLQSAGASSATDAWAAGYYNTASSADRTLIEHWNGKAWQLQASPNAGGASDDNLLGGVAGTSASNAWAVGFYHTGTVDQTLIEHWNGTAWTVQTSPDPGVSASLSGVVAISPTDAWAVGSYYNGTEERTLIEHWNGTAWTVVPSPSVGTRANLLRDVTATSARNAWAVGYAGQRHGKTLVEHWNGKAWTIQASANLGHGGSYLYGVAATSATSALAAGNYTGHTDRTLIEHCC